MIVLVLLNQVLIVVEPAVALQMEIVEVQMVVIKHVGTLVVGTTYK
jgi:hypothetical protein